MDGLYFNYDVHVSKNFFETFFQSFGGQVCLFDSIKTGVHFCVSNGASVLDRFITFR